MLKFGEANAKLAALEKYVGRVYTFSLLSGHTCPFAKDCLSKAIRTNGKTSIQDGPHTKFRCFSASEESLYPNVYDSRNDNWQILRKCGTQENMAALIIASLPKLAKCIRVHVGGDFFNQLYFNAWMETARAKPDILFYAYTKSLPFWVAAKAAKSIPPNFTLTASKGGYKDGLIQQYRLRQAVVIAEPKLCQAIVDSGNHDVIPSGKYKGWEIDHDDSHAALPSLKNKSFALLVHGTQPAGGESQKAKRILNGVGSYNRNKDV